MGVLKITKQGPPKFLTQRKIITNPYKSLPSIFFKYLCGPTQKNKINPSFDQIS